MEWSSWLKENQGCDLQIPYCAYSSCSLQFQTVVYVRRYSSSLYRKMYWVLLVHSSKLTNKSINSPLQYYNIFQIAFFEILAAHHRVLLVLEPTCGRAPKHGCTDRTRLDSSTHVLGARQTSPTAASAAKEAPERFALFHLGFFEISVEQRNAKF